MIETKDPVKEISTKTAIGAKGAVGKEGDTILSNEKYCDYCGEVIYIGDPYYMHAGLRICSGCARSYAWAVFEQEAMLRKFEFDQLLDLLPKDE
jgi:hypothetical protein